DRMDRLENLERLYMAWERLPQREQDVLYLFVSEVETETKMRSMTQKEIGQELGIAQSTVSDTIRRGIIHLRNEMSGFTT
ncbi:MAG: sigma-70 family RNA polymerase sigma factor, partial [Oscillibacter sp.]|nr:sigma-70 family RNA polymerase sigma factor [Oscillibacter sp.]